MGKVVTGLCAVIVSVSFCIGNAAADRIDDAIALSKSTNRPLLAIGSADFCPPCRKLHHTMETDPQLQPVLQDCVVLKMDSQTQEFQDFVNRFPADASRIPMVYVVLPSGDPIYAQSGGMDGNKLTGLLNQAISYSRPAIDDSQTMLASAVGSIPKSDIEAILKSARSHAQSGNLVQALDLVSPIADMDGDSELVTKARSYETRLKVVISNWMNELGSQLENNDSIHGASYRIAELYVKLPEHPQLRSQARELLVRFEGQPATKVAVQQAKFLLKARFYEDKKDCHNAITNYTAVVDLDGQSPAAYFASLRLGKLNERQATKMTAKVH